jgi:hypothetical protein
MVSHCPHCSDLNKEGIHPDLLCPGCQECERVRAEVESLRTEMGAIAVAVGRSQMDGNDTDWFELGQDVKEKCARLDLAERVVRAEQATRKENRGSFTEDLLRIRRARLELHEALAAWEEAHG